MLLLGSLFRSRILVPSKLPASTRCRTELAPRKTKYKKAHKGRVPLPLGGSTKGTTLEFGEYGLRVVGDDASRLTAKQLKSADTALKRKLKVVKGANVWMRVFPDIPVCVKVPVLPVFSGNETRMGKGKGTFEYWACRAGPGRVIFEVGGGGLREEIARDALRIAAAKLPFRTEFITPAALPRLGNLLIPRPYLITDASSIAAAEDASAPQQSV
ncbi:hypothetical protein BS47DRAFT_1303160 [Hydnum rufescens UP504]|uniref:Ribosomal protein L16 n=1 Tax=Hydnum rufescens UP504 TaxID=1448309 RepID=A0A9P6ALT0_9AGAM|nr:hypothetical protein BS47DRAFT_1303160 [Hydnum rufescens UP504]